MKIKNTDKKGFTLIEVIVTLLLVSITAALAGMWIVSIAKGYNFSKMNMGSIQNAQLTMTRLVKEFKAINVVSAASVNGITYSRVDYALGSVAGSVSKSGSLLQLNGNTLTDGVSAFTLAFCDNVNDVSCPSTWSSTRRFIEITLTLTGAENIQSTFTQRVAPRNL